MTNLANLTELNVGEKFGENGTVIDKKDNLFTIIVEEGEKYYLDVYKIMKGSTKRRRRQKITEEKYNRYKSIAMKK
jgi:hypothetical protein